jgi:hypothetical protein
VISKEQLAICDRFGVQPVEAMSQLKVGITDNVGLAQPLNGLRHPPEGDTTGWYIWAGEILPTADDAFTPLHVSHLPTRCPLVMPYLALPPGWRFLLAPGHEDIWYDESLLVI